MISYTHILFDLDGTITESYPGIINSVKYALGKFGISETDDANLRRFIGPPLLDSFQNFYGFSEAKAVEAMHVYREYYAEKGIFECSVYEGLPELFSKLKDAGKKLYVATSKPELYMTRILDHFNMTNYFDFAGGADIEERHGKKSEVIQFVLLNAGLLQMKLHGSVTGDAAAQGAVMVGDRKFDILGAQFNKIPSIGVLYGYGNRAELNEAGATHIAETVEDLGKILCT
jgi:phosphoglycolate phosphatase